MYAKWIPSIEILVPLLGTGYWNNSLPGPEGRNFHKFDYISEPVYWFLPYHVVAHTGLKGEVSPNNNVDWVSRKQFLQTQQ